MLRLCFELSAYAERQYDTRKNKIIDGLSEITFGILTNLFSRPQNELIIKLTDEDAWKLLRMRRPYCGSKMPLGYLKQLGLDRAFE